MDTTNKSPKQQKKASSTAQMTYMKVITIALFGFLLATSATAFRRQIASNYYANTYADQAAAMAQQGSTTAYQQALAYPGVGIWGAPVGGLGSSVNYYSDSYNNQAAAASSTGSTVSSSNVNLGLGGSASNYEATEYNNQAAAASSTGSTTAYSEQTGLGFPGYGSSVNYYNNNYANQAAAQSSTGSTVSAQQFAAPLGLGYGYPIGYPVGYPAGYPVGYPVGYPIYY